MLQHTSSFVGASGCFRMRGSETKELKVGMSVEEVVDLMGEPDRKTDSESERSYLYGLGRGLIDYEEFHVIFDES